MNHTPARILLTLALFCSSALAQTGMPIPTPPASSPPLTSPVTPSPAPAAPIPAAPSTSSEASTLTPVQVDGNLILISQSLIRYAFDPVTGILTIPSFTLTNTTNLPHTLEWKQQGPDLLLTLKPGTRYSLNGDGKQLTLSSPPPVTNTDNRVPVLYPLANADPATVISLLQRFFPGIQVELDPRQRALMMLLPQDQRPLILQTLQQLDQERPQVMFEAEILEINTDLTQSLGLQYDSIFTFKIGEGTPAGLLNLGDISRSPLSLTVGLNALKTSGAAKELARPRVTTLDGQTARINSTQTTPIVLPGGGSAATTVQNVTTGITLTMTPKVAPDGTVEAVLSIIVSIPTGTTSQGVPQFSTREATTTVRVRNGEPIAIGGLLESRKIEGVQKVPLLGDIPILGKLFTTTRTDVHNTDLVIVVTPRIVLSVGQK